MIHRFVIDLNDKVKGYKNDIDELERRFGAEEVPYVAPKSETHLRCIRCGRKLKNQEAQQRGYGEICWKKHQADNQTILF